MLPDFRQIPFISSEAQGFSRFKKFDDKPERNLEIATLVCTGCSGDAEVLLKSRRFRVVRRNNFPDKTRFSRQIPHCNVYKKGSDESIRNIIIPGHF